MTKPVKKNSAASMVEHLTVVLSDTYVLGIKTHGFHWNVTGPLFPQLHAQFSDQYESLFEAADDLAERIRALNAPAPGGAAEFLQHSIIKEAPAKPLSAKAMIADLLESHEALRERLEAARAWADEIGDKASEDMLIGRLEAHDKTIWMLRSQLD